jgi:CheY-like chemotaxis protein
MLKGINILVVEDNELNQRVTNYMLLKQHANIVNATDGHKAIELLRVDHFDVVLMDLQMPGMDGFATTRYIRQQLNSNVPVIGFTADLLTGDSEECANAGMNLCLAKPIDAIVLTELILDIVADVHKQ